MQVHIWLFDGNSFQKDSRDKRPINKKLILVVHSTSALNVLSLILMMLAIFCDLIIEYVGFQSRIVGWMETKTINGLHSQMMLMGEDERKTMSDRIFIGKTMYVERRWKEKMLCWNWTVTGLLLKEKNSCRMWRWRCIAYSDRKALNAKKIKGFGASGVVRVYTTFF